MFLTKLKFVAAVVVTVAALGLGVGAGAYPALAAPESAGEPAPAVPTQPAAQRLPDRQGKGVTLTGWGKAIDPDNDCEFQLGRQGKLTIKIPGKDHALSFERNQMNAPRVLQPVEGDFIVQTKLSGAYPAGAVSVVDGRRPFHGAGLVLW